MNAMNEKGFSLVEVLVAITLLAIGLLAVAGMQTTAITGNAFAQRGTVAISLAEEMIDQVRTHCGNTPETYNGIDTSASLSGLSGSALADAQAWKGRLEDPRLHSLLNASGTVAVSTNNPTDNAATVTVEVFWGPDGNRRKITLTTIVETWGT
jgi:type IV pilus assembly protein PilV